MMSGSDGLEGIVAAETVLSDVDGQAGRLIIRGYSLDEIAGRWTFEEVIALLWSGFLDPLPTDMRAALGAARAEGAVELAALDPELAGRTPVEAMRSVKWAKSPRACRSDPQMPVDRERTPTWPDPGVGSGTSPTTNCPPLVTAARMLAPRPNGSLTVRLVPLCAW